MTKNDPFFTDRFFIIILHTLSIVIFQNFLYNRLHLFYFIKEVTVLKEKENFDNLNTEENTPSDSLDKNDKTDYKDYLQQLTEQEEASHSNAKKESDKLSSDEKSENVDISSKSDKSFKAFVEKLKAMPKKKKVIISVVTVVVILLIILFSIIASYFNLIDWNSGEDYVAPTGDDYIQDDNMNLDPMSAVTDATGLQDYLEKWHNNGGDLMQSNNVVNVLLMGLDESKSHSDSMILLSINKVSKEIIMSSFFRDTYTYSDTYSTATGSHYMKLTEVYTFGGPKAVINTIEKDYKIKIDGYVSVDFTTFPDVIDAIGGVTVDVQPYEAAYMASSWNTPVPSGENVKLNGQQALMFSRIRKCDADGDVSRTRRQRMVITALIEGAKNIKVSQIDNLLTTLLPSVSTSFGRFDFIKYGTQAITYNWMSYPIEQLQMPNEANRTSATINSTWYWISDFPLCARDLQMAIYGKTNIELDENEETVMDFFSTISKPSSPSNDAPQAEPSENQPSESQVPDSTQQPAPSETESSSANVPESSSEETSAPPASEPTTSGNEDAQALD